MNTTITKFGYPATLVAEYEHWVVLARQKQITAGCLILASKSEATSLPALPVAAFTELKKVSADLEATLNSITQCERINYVVLMMVDPHVHFHVIPRHSGPRLIAGTSFNDPGWPKHPDFGATVSMSEEAFGRLTAEFRTRWNRTGR